MEHLLQFDEICLKLAAVGERVGDDEKLVVHMGSLPQEYDAMVRVIEATNGITLLGAKEMLRREYDTLQKREKKEMCSRPVFVRPEVRPRERNAMGLAGTRRRMGVFRGRCYACNQRGHRKSDCPRNKEKAGDEFVFSVMTGSSGDDTVWLLDSGVSCHMTGDIADFVEYSDLSQSIWVTVANCQRLEAKGRGSVRFVIGSERTVKLTDVLFLPQLGSKLVSVASLTAHGVIVQFEQHRAVVQVGGSVVATVPKVGKLFAWSVGRRAREEANLVAGDTSVSGSVALWHARLGHVSGAKMKMVASACDGVPGFGDAEASESTVCNGCARGKMTTSPFSHTSGTEVKTNVPFELVHSDVMGPIKPVSKGGAKYIVTFIDDYTRMVYVYPIKAKSEVFDRFKTFMAMVETQYGARVRCLRSDNGDEYTSKRFNQLCTTMGILHQTSAPYSSQQNGLAERMNRTLAEGARACMHAMNVEHVWWAEAILHFAHVLNRIPNSARPDKSPVEVLTGERPGLDYLRVFGAQGFYRIDDSKRTKFDARVHPCMLLGYSETSKAYRLWDQEEARIVVTHSVVLNEYPLHTHRTVVFVEGEGSQSASSVDWDEKQLRIDGAPRPSSPRTGPEEMEVDGEERGGDVEMDDGGDASVSLVPIAGGGNEAGARVQAPGVDVSIGPSLAPLRINGQGPSVRPPSIESGERFAPPTLPAPVPASDRLVFSGGSSRPRTLAYQQRPLLTDHATAMSERALQPPRLSADPSGLSCGDATERESKRPRMDSYEIALAASDVPQTYAEAMASEEAEQWKQAVRSEIRSHVRNHTWDMVMRPRGAKVIGSKWVFARKYDENGNVIRHKARLVAQGFCQTHGVDYFHTYSPVASMNSIRLFLPLCCSKGLKIKQFDVETAFLNGELEEQVFMSPPSGIRAADGMVCQLRRSLYGHKQAGAVWYKTIRDVFLAMGSTQCRADPCLFVRRKRDGDDDESAVYIVLYVYDLLVGCAQDDEAEKVREELGARFTLKSLGDARFVLGMEIKYDMEKGELILKQAQFITKMLQKFGCDDAHAVRSPMVLGQDLLPTDDQDVLDDKTKYRELVGSLLYVANATRPDVSVALSVLSQFLDSPRAMHWRAAKRVLCYLKGTQNHGIQFTRDKDNAISMATYCDANWGGDTATRSPVERCLDDSNGQQVSMATNQGYTPRAKHIDLRAHFVRDHVQNGDIKLNYVPSENQLSDFLTKAVPTPRLAQLCFACGLRVSDS